MRKAGGPVLVYPVNKRQPDMKQYSEACEQNRLPILEILRNEFSAAQHVLEIGSGTGQHAVYFSRHLPHLQWQTSDLESHHASIRAWLAEAGLANAKPPILLDVSRVKWPAAGFDGVFSANTTHIMKWSEVEDMFAGVGKLLEPRGRFCLYGPFNYGNRYTSHSNQRFDLWLKSRDADSGLRNFEDLDELADRCGLKLRADHPMPVNNRLLVWEKD
jgi:cyclopropane fatty-acyl-phospholipid synthase-like methyltransferase